MRLMSFANKLCFETNTIFTFAELLAYSNNNIPTEVNKKKKNK